MWIGLWRAGGDASSEELVAVFLAEPLFTSVSGATYIENMGGRPLTGLPVDIFASVINFIPTIVFPEKLELISNLTYDPNKYSPFGASALMVNIYSNFGIFFPVYFFAIGIFYGYLRKKAKYSRFYLAVYFSVLPLLMFNAFILPAVIVIFLSFIFHKKSKLQRSEIVSK